MSVQMVNFTVTGEFLTEHHRDLVSEGNWRLGLKNLMTSLMGISNDQCIQILKGEARLIGDSASDKGIEMIFLDDARYTDEFRERDAEYLKHLEWLYGHLLRSSNGTFYEPYCYIDDFGFEDMESHQLRGMVYQVSGRKDIGVVPIIEEQKFQKYMKPLTEWKFRRAAHYLYDKQNDVLMNKVIKEYGIHDAFVGFQKAEVNDPPIWIDLPKSWDESLEIYLKQHNLTRLGNKYLYPPETEESKAFKKKREELSNKAKEYMESPETKKLQKEIEKIRKESEESDKRTAEYKKQIEESEKSIAESEKNIAEFEEKINTYEDEWIEDAETMMNQLDKDFANEVPLTYSQNRYKYNEVKEHISYGGIIKDDESVSEMITKLKTYKKKFDEEERRRTEWEEKEEKRLYTVLRRKILKQARANGGFFDLKVKKADKLGRERTKTFKVPVAPFEHYALKGRSFLCASSHEDRLPEWEIVSPSGMKMQMDNRYHTDWLIGAGLPLDCMYHDSYKEGHDEFREAIDIAVWDKTSEIQDRYTEQFGKHKIVSLCGSGSFSGVAIHVNPTDDFSRIPDVDFVAITPSAHPNFVGLFDHPNMQGMISHSGGAVCHLATVGRPKNWKIVRLFNAPLIIKERSRVRVNMERRELIVD